MWGSAIVCKCFCATWPFLILCSPLPKSRDSECDVPQSSSHRWEHKTAQVMRSGSASVVSLTPLCFQPHPMVMLKPVPASQNGERRAVRLLWFQRYSGTRCPCRNWSWKSWKGYVDFGQRRKLNTEPGTKIHLQHPTTSPLYYSCPRSTQTHLCEGDISASQLFTNKNLKFSILKAAWEMKHRYLSV